MDTELSRKDGDVADAMRCLAGHDVLGLAWIDPDLTVTACFGRKARFIAIGRPVSDSVLPLIGLEPHLLSFQCTPTQRLDVPGVVIHASAETSDRYNLSVFWSPRDRHYLLLLAVAPVDATLEVELLRQVRARLMAEAVTRSKSEQLARANRDLEDFATIVSHDLKAPVRALRHTAGDIDTAVARGNYDEARAGLAWMQAETRRLSAMLSGLLQYSSIGRKVEAIEPTSTRAIASAIAASIPIASGRTVLMTGDWPVIETLKAPLELVLRNLVDNAIKHHDLERSTIILSCEEMPDALQLSVSDDGPGIRVEHHSAIFLPFRTLDTPGSPQSGGSGLGLALVKRTVESIGGSIQVRSDADRLRGTSFDIRWPKAIVT